MLSADLDTDKKDTRYHPLNGLLEEADETCDPPKRKYDEQPGLGPLHKVPEEVILSIIAHLDVPSMLNFMQTCKYLHYYVDRKSVWLDALESTLRRRPVPLSYRNLVSRGTTAESPLEDVRSAVRRATQLEHAFRQDVIFPSRVLCRDGYIGSNQDRLHWVWNLDIDRFTMAYSVDRWFSCTVNATGQVIAFQVERQCSCWDFDFDLEGITVIFNSLQDFGDQSFFIYRISLGDGTSRLVSRTPAQGWVRSNFIEDDIAGCVLTRGAGTEIMLHVVNWRSGKCALINTGISSPQTFSASSTKKYLLMSSESMDQLQAWTYEFRLLQATIDQTDTPERPFLAAVSPQYYHLTQFVPQGIPQRWSGRIVPTTRGMWCNRKCIFSVFHQENEIKECITYSLVSDGTSPSDIQTMEGLPETDQEFSKDQDGTKRSNSVSRRTFIYHLPEDRRLSLGGGWYSLCAFGHSGKHAVWVEETEDESGEHTCLFATFDHEDDGAEGPVCSRVTRLVINDERFDWNMVLKIELDDNAGILLCMTDTKIWSIYL